MPLARLHGSEIANGNIVDADDLNDEFNQLVNILNGTSADKDAIIKLSSATLAVLTLNQQNAAGPIQIWQANAVDKLKVNSLGQLESVIATGIAPLVVASTTKVNNLNADLLDGLDSAAFALLNTHKTGFSIPFTVDNPDVLAIGTNTVGACFIAPDLAAGALITKIRANYIEGSHTGGTSITFKLFLRTAASAYGAQTEIGTISLNDTNNAGIIVYENNVSDVPIASADIIFCVVSAKTGSAAERKVSICAIGSQKLTT